MMPIAPVVVLTLALTPTGFSPNRLPDSTRSITDADTVFAVYAEDWGRRSAGSTKLILVVWGDGHIVWSEDQVHGGAPYRSGQVNRERPLAFLRRLDGDGAFGDQKLGRAWFGPDAQFTTILANFGKRRLKMQSWHELSEDNGKAVATTAGIEPLAGRRRFDVLRKESADYLYYRFVWSAIRATAAGLAPSKSTPISGETVMKSGVIVWRESATKSEP